MSYVRLLLSFSGKISRVEFLKGVLIVLLLYAIATLLVFFAINSQPNSIAPRHVQPSVAQPSTAQPGTADLNALAKNIQANIDDLSSSIRFGSIQKSSTPSIAQPETGDLNAIATKIQASIDDLFRMQIFLIPATIISLFSLYILLAIEVKRLRDMGWPVWLVVLNVLNYFHYLVVVGLIIIAICLFKPSKIE